MKKLLSLILTAALLCTLALSVSAKPLLNNRTEVFDALEILRHVIDLPTETEVTVATHDFDGNGVIEVADALIALRYVIGLDVGVANNDKEVSARGEPSNNLNGGLEPDADGNFRDVIIQHIASNSFDITKFYCFDATDVDGYRLADVSVSKYGFDYTFVRGETLEVRFNVSNCGQFGIFCGGCSSACTVMCSRFYAFTDGIDFPRLVAISHEPDGYDPTGVHELLRRIIDSAVLLVRVD